MSLLVSLRSGSHQVAIMGFQVLDVAFAGLALYLVGRLTWGRSVPLPPGPPGRPLIGNLLDFPADAPYKTFGAMSSKYGKCMLASHKVQMHRSLYGRPYRIPQSDGHAIRCAQLPQG